MGVWHLWPCSSQEVVWCTTSVQLKYQRKNFNSLFRRGPGNNVPEEVWIILLDGSCIFRYVTTLDSHNKAVLWLSQLCGHWSLLHTIQDNINWKSFLVLQKGKGFDVGWKKVDGTPRERGWVWGQKVHRNRERENRWASDCPFWRYPWGWNPFLGLVEIWPARGGL